MSKMKERYPEKVLFTLIQPWAYIQFTLKSRKETKMKQKIFEYTNQNKLLFQDYQ